MPAKSRPAEQPLRQCAMGFRQVAAKDLGTGVPPPLPAEPRSPAGPFPSESGGASENTASAVVDAQLRWQIAFYFSSENLRRDDYMMRILGPQAVGPIPIAKIAKFYRMADLTHDIDRITAVMRGMDLLEVSEDETSVRRVSPLLDTETDDSSAC